jgi:hypothetical protein
MISAVQFYDVVLFFHIAFVVLAFGPTFAYPVFLAMAERTDARALPAVGRAIIAWDRIAQILLLGILIAGVYMVATNSGLGAAWEFSDFFVGWGFVAVIVIGAASGGYFTPKTREMIEIVERDIAAAGDGPVTLSNDFQSLNQQVAKVGTAVGIFTILTIYVMTAKPFL